MYWSPGMCTASIDLALNRYRTCLHSIIGNVDTYSDYLYDRKTNWPIAFSEGCESEWRINLESFTRFCGLDDLKESGK